MPYKVTTSPNFERDLKSFKNDKTQKEAISNALKIIIQDPLDGKPLTGQWKGFHNFAFSKKPELRILYSVYTCCPNELKEKSQCRFDDVETNDIDYIKCSGLINFVFVKTREACNNLYAKDKGYVKSFFLE